MKTLAFLAICLMAVLASCDDTERTYFTIKVDSIAAPERVEVGKSFSAKFYGEIGSDGCYRLNRIERNGQSLGEEIIFHGVHEVSPETACTMAFVYLDDEYTSEYGKTLSFIPKTKGNFTISVRRPDNSVLKKTVVVE